MKLIFVSLILMFLLSCGASPAPPPEMPNVQPPQPTASAYLTTSPERIYKLPSVLNEVSGITGLDSAHVAVVQDERGIVFVFDLVSGKVVNQFSFDSLGDFEGIAYTGSSLFILRSDGRLTEWEDFDKQNGSGKITHYSLQLQTKDNEGLCYDKANHRLLIAAKSKPENPGEKDERYVYSFNLTQKELVPEPVYKFNINTLSAFADDTGFYTGSSAIRKPKIFNFRPSGLSIHPVTNEIYVLSATDQMMIRFDTTGKPLTMTSLVQSHFTKPEGITFLSDSTMVICNEAEGSVPTILTFQLK